MRDHKKPCFALDEASTIEYVWPCQPYSRIAHPDCKLMQWENCQHGALSNRLNYYRWYWQKRRKHAKA